MIELDINTDAMVVYSRKLEQLSRSALPVAVRMTLNDAAFDVKQKTLQESAKKNFIQRAPTFFKVFSGVNKASGFNINSMKAEVGMTANGNQTAQTAVAHMQQQEIGGAIKDGLDYLKAARSGSNRRRVKKGNYFDKSNLVRGAFKRPNASAKSRFVAAAIVALQTGKLMKFKSAAGKTLFARVISMSSSLSKKKFGRLQIKTQILYEDRQTVHIKATHFSREAAMITQKKMPDMYYKNAKKQFERALR